jgi:transposase
LCAVYVIDDRFWRGSWPAVAYVYSEGRAHAHPIEHLAGFRGVLQVDAFAGFDRLPAQRTDSADTSNMGTVTEMDGIPV